MSARILIAIAALIVALATLPMFGGISPAAAQAAQLSQSTLPPQFGVPPHRIEIYPSRPLYRRCTDWYELQNRPSGPVLYPQKHCWWVRG
jgi:hypothetical protein